MSLYLLHHQCNNKLLGGKRKTILYMLVIPGNGPKDTFLEEEKCSHGNIKFPNNGEAKRIACATQKSNLNKKSNLNNLRN